MIFLNNIPYELIDDKWYPAVFGGADTEETVTDNPDPEPDVVEDWKTSLSDEVKTAIGDTDLSTVATEYVKLKGERDKLIPIPEDDTGRDELYTKLGRPTAPEGYTLPTLPEDQTYNEEFVKSMRGVAHTAGLSQSQWEKMLMGYQRTAEESVKSAKEATTVAEAELKSEWGAAYPRHIGLAQRAIRSMGGDDVFDVIESSMLGNHPGFIKMMAKIGMNLAEEGIIESVGVGQQSKEDAQTEVQRITMSKEYLTPSHPDHAAAVQKAQKLFQYIYD